MTSTNERLKRQRARLFHEQGGLCYWCDKPMHLPEKYPPTGMPAANWCTLDHLRDRLNHSRRDPAQPGERRHVAACSECNHERMRAVFRGMGIFHPSPFAAQQSNAVAKEDAA
jgi:hypothetical protein